MRQISWGPQSQCLCHVLAPFRQSGKDFCTCDIRANLRRRGSFHSGKFVSLGKMSARPLLYLSATFMRCGVSVFEERVKNPFTGFLRSPLAALAESERNAVEEAGAAALCVGLSLVSAGQRSPEGRPEGPWGGPRPRRPADRLRKMSQQPRGYRCPSASMPRRTCSPRCIALLAAVPHHECPLKALVLGTTLQVEI